MNYPKAKLLKATPDGPASWLVTVECPYACPGGASGSPGRSKSSTHQHHLQASGLSAQELRVPHCSGFNALLSSLLSDIQLVDSDLVLDEAIEKRAKS
jgi:hypothetical protein